MLQQLTPYPGWSRPEIPEDGTHTRLCWKPSLVLLIRKVWVEARAPVVLVSSQVRLMLLFWGPHSETRSSEGLPFPGTARWKWMILIPFKTAILGGKMMV